MKNKLAAITLLMVLTLLVALVAILPVTAEPHVKEQFQTGGDGTAEWTAAEAHTGNWSVLLGATGNPGCSNWARVVMPYGQPLSTISSISFWQNIKESTLTSIPAIQWADGIARSGYYGAYIILEIDKNGDGSISYPEDDWLVLWHYGEDSLGTWVKRSTVAGFHTGKGPDHTVGTDDDVTGQSYWHSVTSTDYITWDTDAEWGYYNCGNLTEWQGTPLGGKTVLNIKIAVGEWTFPFRTEAYVDDIEINGVTYLSEPTVLYVDPALTEKCTPAYGQPFTVNIKVDNVQDLYGFQFKLSWNTSLLDFVGAVHNAAGIWGAGNFYVALDQANEAGGYYEFAVTATPPAVGKTGDFLLVTITFKVTYDPIYGQTTAECALDLENTILGDSAGSAIPHVVVDGEYVNHATQPKVKIFFPIPSNPYSDEYNATKLAETFSADIYVYDVVNLAKFELVVSYNTMLLDAIYAAVGPFLPPPYVTSSVAINDAAGTVTFLVETFTPVSGDGKIATMIFKVTKESYWKTVNPGILSCDIVPSGSLWSIDSLTAELLEVGQPEFYSGLYRYKPVPGDLNADGATNVLDLGRVALVFGWTGTPCEIKEDINADGEINVLDLIIVATRYT